MASPELLWRPLSPHGEDHFGGSQTALKYKKGLVAEFHTSGVAWVVLAVRGGRGGAPDPQVSTSLSSLDSLIHSSNLRHRGIRRIEFDEGSQASRRFQSG